MEFQWPLLLLSLGIVPLLIAGYVAAQRRRRAYAVRFTNLALLRDVVGAGPGRRRHIPPALFLLGLAALLVSLARPTAVIAVPRDQSAVVLVMDTSGSMSADDLDPNRMEAAKEAAAGFVERLPRGMQVGLVGFNQEAIVRASITDDHDDVRRAIEAMRADGGTAIGDGLDAALDQLAQRPADPQGQRPPGMVVLLSDGASNAGQQPSSAAARASGEGVQVHTVGIGDRDETPLIGGRQPARLDEATLENIAEQTGGRYYYAEAAGELEDVYERIGSQVSWVEERTEVTAFASALGAACLMVAGFLSLRWFGQLP